MHRATTVIGHGSLESREVGHRHWSHLHLNLWLRLSYLGHWRRRQLRLLHRLLRLRLRLRLHLDRFFYLLLNDNDRRRYERWRQPWFDIDNALDRVFPVDTLDQVFHLLRGLVIVVSFLLHGFKFLPLFDFILDQILWLSVSERSSCFHQFLKKVLLHCVGSSLCFNLALAQVHSILIVNFSKIYTLGLSYYHSDGSHRAIK